MEELHKLSISKKVLASGSGNLSLYPDGSKLIFHYKTQLCDDQNTVLDDSRKYDKPMELLFGKQFKLDVWEPCLRTMRVNEIAEFIVPSMQVTAYPSVAQKLREFATGRKINTDENQHQCCGMAQMKAPSTGHDDLNELVRNPQQLKFTFELLSFMLTGEYKKETWAMNDEEKLAALPHLREEGNLLYKNKNFKEAEDKYAEALGCLENLLIHEQPGTDEWFRVDNLRIPFLLNYSQCKLLSEDYLPVIEHTTAVLTKDNDNVKAFFRRGKANAACWNFDEAQKDFKRAAELEPSLAVAVSKELKNIEIKQKQKDVEDKSKMKNLFIPQ